jgi:3',5'-cyclic-AMP phosphodiesterase
MTARTLAHISDLHIGKDAATDRAARALCERLLEAQVDHVALTGDVTHRGQQRELETFLSIFEPWLAAGRISIVPGNHDRLGDAASALMSLSSPGAGRVATERAPGLHVVRFDSTGPHNKALLSGQGLLTADDAEEIVAAFPGGEAGTDDGRLRVLLLHHHLLPYPHDNGAEWLVTLLGSPCAEELALGRALLASLRGRCDLVLHGHRHRPGVFTLHREDARPLTILNAGSTTALGQARLLEHAGGRLAEPPRWVAAGGSARPRPRPVREHVLAVG